jgi:hypothetical protein
MSGTRTTAHRPGRGCRSGTAANLARARWAATKPVTEEDFKQQLLKNGPMSSLPIPLDSTARRDFQPIKLEGEPLSETIVRERR